MRRRHSVITDKLEKIKGRRTAYSAGCHCLDALDRHRGFRLVSIAKYGVLGDGSKS